MCEVSRYWAYTCSSFVPASQCDEMCYRIRLLALVFSFTLRCLQTNFKSGSHCKRPASCWHSRISDGLYCPWNLQCCCIGTQFSGSPKADAAGQCSLGTSQTWAWIAQWCTPDFPFPTAVWLSNCLTVYLTIIIFHPPSKSCSAVFWRPQLFWMTFLVGFLLCALEVKERALSLTESFKNYHNLAFLLLFKVPQPCFNLLLTLLR